MVEAGTLMLANWAETGDLPIAGNFQPSPDGRGHRAVAAPVPLPVGLPTGEK